MVMVQKPGTSKRLSYCNGAGHVAVEQNTILGRVRTEQVCPKCNEVVRI